jgi:NADPH:quinone reductase
VKHARGFNFMSRQLGQHITDCVVELVRSQRVRPVIGRVVEFDDLPAAIEAMANRQTTGRTIVSV